MNENPPTPEFPSGRDVPAVPSSPPPPPPSGAVPPPPPLRTPPPLPPPPPRTPLPPTDSLMGSDTSQVHAADVPPTQAPNALEKFVAILKSDLSNKTPQQLLRSYAWHLVAVVVVAAIAFMLTYEFFGVLLVGTLYCCFLGIKNPEAFRFLFKGKTSKATVGWTFALLALVFANICSNLEPK